jgi:hypothetical protein
MNAPPIGNLWDDIKGGIQDGADAVGEALAGAWDLIDDIPGFEQLGDGTKALFKGPLRDFAQGSIGQSVLRALASFAMGPVGYVAGPWAMMCAASLPGMMRGDAFADALLSENLWRLEKTVEILGVDAGEIFAQQFGTALDYLRERASEMGLDPGDAVMQLAAEAGIDPEAYANELAKDLGVRADAAVQAVETALGQPISKREDYNPVTGARVRRIPLTSTLQTRSRVAELREAERQEDMRARLRAATAIPLSSQLTMARFRLAEPAPAPVLDRAASSRLEPAHDEETDTGSAALAVGVGVVALAAGFAIWRYL